MFENNVLEGAARRNEGQKQTMPEDRGILLLVNILTALI